MDNILSKGGTQAKLALQIRFIKYAISNRKKSFPNFIIPGAAKSGTTSLNFYLDQHPEIFMCPVKEPNYFSSDINPRDFSEEYRIREKRNSFNIEQYIEGSMTEKKWDVFIRRWEHYTKLFKNVRGEKAIGEVSNSYLYSKVAAVNIKKKIPDAKIVIILRDPVERAFSQYLMRFRDGWTLKGFREEIAADLRKTRKGWHISNLYLEMGLYYEQVRRYLQLFPTKNVRIYLFDDFRNNPKSVVENILRFLGVDHKIQLDFSKKHNVSKQPRFVYFNHLIAKYGIKKRAIKLIPGRFRKNVKDMFFTGNARQELRDNDRAYLRNYYQEDVKKLSKLLNRDLSFWLQ